MKASFLVCAIVSMMAASAQADYPTVWTIHNHSQLNIYLKCVSKNPNGLSEPIEFSAYIVAHRSRKLEWAGWHNDGVGLNPGKWNCVVGTTPSEKKYSGPSFTTGWGESIVLDLTLRDDGNFLIKKKV